MSWPLYTPQRVPQPWLFHVSYVSLRFLSCSSSLPQTLDPIHFSPFQAQLKCTSLRLPSAPTD